MSKSNLYNAVKDNGPATTTDGADTEHCGIPKKIVKFTVKELDIAIRSMKNGRASDNAGVLAEMIKDAGAIMQEIWTKHSISKNRRTK